MEMIFDDIDPLAVGWKRALELVGGNDDGISFVENFFLRDFALPITTSAIGEHLGFPTWKTDKEIAKTLDEIDRGFRVLHKDFLDSVIKQDYKTSLKIYDKIGLEINQKCENLKNEIQQEMLISKQTR